MYEGKEVTTFYTKGTGRKISYHLQLVYLDMELLPKGSFPLSSLFLRDAIACASDWIRVAHESKTRRFVAEILSDSTARDQLIARRD